MRDEEATADDPTSPEPAADLGAGYRSPQRRPAATIALLVAVLAATVWELATYGLSPSAPNLARAGGSSLGAFAHNGWWKLLGANFLHGGIVHVASNTIVLLIIGATLEREVGRRVLLAVVAWSLLGTSLGALALSGDTVSVGASGICFALMGAGFVADPHRRTALGQQAWGLLPINVILTFAVPHISIGGHVGGLAAGVIVGYVTCTRHAAPRAPIWGSTMLAFGVAACASTVLVPVVLAHTAPRTMQQVDGALVRPSLERQLRTSLVSGGVREQVSRAACRSVRGSAASWECSVTADAGRGTYSFVYGDDDSWSGRRIGG